MRFIDLRIENHNKCNYDYVEIFNGGLASSPSMGRYCGTNKPDDFRSQSNEVRIEFHTDQTQSERGFLFEYTFEAEGTLLFRIRRNYFSTFLGISMLYVVDI